MEKQEYEVIIKLLITKLAETENDKYFLEYCKVANLEAENAKLKEEVARLNELLNPTKEGGLENE